MLKKYFNTLSVNDKLHILNTYFQTQTYLFMQSLYCFIMF